MVFEFHDIDRLIRMAIKPHALTLNVEGPAPPLHGGYTILTFDPEGRLVGAFIDGRHFKRGFDNRLIEKWHEKGVFGKSRIHRDLPVREKRVFLNHVRIVAADIALAFQQKSDCVEPSHRSEIAAWLDRILEYSPEVLDHEHDRFLAIYRPVGILPPDQYLALILQATEGCSYNRCTFCNFYRNIHFHIKTEEEFQHHIEGVKAFLGESIRLRKSVFLADANALIIPQDRLVRLLDLTNAAFPERSVYAFIDAFNTSRKTAQDFAEMRARRIERVYIGVETGDSDLFRFLNKPGTQAQILDAVSMIKAGGIAIGIIVMVGVGGDRYAESHTRATIDLVNAMPLEKSDIIYFSEFVEHPELPYARLAGEQGIHSLSPFMMREQMETIRRGFHFPEDRRPRVSIYDIREFIY